MHVPSTDSHKGQNGRLLIIGGSSLFHAASLWAAELASHFVDMVHYSSTEENEKIFVALKTKFRNGIIVHKKELREYIQEDDAVLVGPGMLRGKKTERVEETFDEILKITDEATYTAAITCHILEHYPGKKVVLDAGALQMVPLDCLSSTKSKIILTPHQLEFSSLFGIDVSVLSFEDKQKVVAEKAKEYNCVIILKAVVDIVSDGKNTYTIEGGNAGLTKGGSGDVLGSLIASLYTKNDAVLSCVMASYVVKTAADHLFEEKGYWYNIDDLIKTIPHCIAGK